MDLTILIPALNEEANLKRLLPVVFATLAKITNSYEVIVIDGDSQDNSQGVAGYFGAKVIIQASRGYGMALRAGFAASQGEYIITMDSDLSHLPEFILSLWEKRKDAELIIASRYVKDGKAEMPLLRRFLSRLLNAFFAFGLCLPFKDLSSGFRLYQRSVLKELHLGSRNFEILEEILLKVYAQGYKTLEVPFHYRARAQGKSHARLFSFGLCYLKSFIGAWNLRNSIYACDYDKRAYYSRIFFQRYWQRKRYRIIESLRSNEGITADVGCGSSKTIIDHPQAIGVDVSMGKLRYLRATNSRLVKASVNALPFKDEALDCLICSEVIEHIPLSPSLFAELNRVLKKGSPLVIGTPDYAKLTWRVLERIYGFVHPGGYRDEHQSHYEADGLKHLLETNGFSVQAHFYICNSELIIKAVKVSSTANPNIKMQKSK